MNKHRLKNMNTGNTMPFSHFHRLYRLAVYFFLLCFLAAPSLSFAQNGAKSEHVRYQLIPERTSVNPGDHLTIGVQYDMAPHWHIYWRNPGDSGLAVRATWDLPKDFVIEDIKWPIPDKIYEGPLANYGYEGQATLLQTLKIPDTLPAGPIDIPLKINVLVCKDICIPESAALTLRLNDPQNIQADNNKTLHDAHAKLPVPLTGNFTFSRQDDTNPKVFSLRLAPENPDLLDAITTDSAEFYPYEWGVVNYPAAPDVQIENGVLTLTHETLGDRALSDIKTVQGVLTYKDAAGEKKGYALEAFPDPHTKQAQSEETTETNVQLANTPSSSQSAASHATQTSVFLALAMAVLGGLILNLMPCVFPVLSIKTLSLVKMAEKHPNVAKTHGLAYTGGIVLSFLLVGAALLILKEAGSAIGWGFQLQNPVVVGILAYLLFIIGLNLMGFFEFGNGLGNLGNKLTQKDSPAGSFFTGILAAVVAAPCTAPFMGTALGFAIVQTAPVALLIFGALGLGLALPYLILSFVPALRKSLPKPGEWMETFKQFLSFPMFASAIWLVWVISQQSGPEGVLFTLTGMLSFTFAIWLARQHKKDSKSKSLVNALVILFALLPIVTLTYIKSSAENRAYASKSDTFGEQFSPERLTHALEGDNPVFVEMTAAWCITCKANHAIALDIEATRTLFQERGIVYLIGDWTNYDEDITQYLEQHGRSGVPLYVFYGAPDPVTKKRPEAKILSQVLTPAIVKRAVEGEL